MTTRTRLTALEDAGGDACLACNPTGARIVMLPIVYAANGEQVTTPTAPCPVCGREPLRLRPMQLDGNREVHA